MGAGRRKNGVRSGVANRLRMGSKNSRVMDTLALSRIPIEDFVNATKKQLAKVMAEVKARSQNFEVCECGRPLGPQGRTREDALEISDDDDVEILAVTYRPILPLPGCYRMPNFDDNFIPGLRGASADNSCGSVCDASTATGRGADDGASSRSRV